MNNAQATTTAIEKNVINLQSKYVALPPRTSVFRFCSFRRRSRPLFDVKKNDSFCGRMNDQHKSTCRQIYPVLFPSPQTAHTDLIQGYYSKYTFRKPDELE